MRAVVQRVLRASVEVDGEVTGQINSGLLVYLSVGPNDGRKDVEYMSRKVAGLRIFGDEQGKMNLSLTDVGGAVLLVPNFTLHGDCRNGRRPSFQAGEPKLAEELFDKVVEFIAKMGIEVQTGRFGAHMHVTSTNNGPVTFLLDSRKLF